MPYNGQLSGKLAELQLAARKAGEQNRPSSNATVPDETEMKLQSDARAFALAATSVFDRSATDSQKISRDLSQKCGDIESSLDQLLNDDSMQILAQQRLAQKTTEMVRLKVAELIKLASLNSFKHENKLTREATYPADRVYHFALIFIFAVLETVVNAVFFQNNAGVVGGAAVALGVAVMNIGSAVWLGHLFSNKNHIDSGRRVVGWGALVVFVLGIIFLNAVISAFRHHYGAITDPTIEATTAAFISALQDGVDLMFFSPHFRDFMSFVLFFIGIGLAIFAFYKGYHQDDIYPGYGEKHRDWAAALAEWENRIEQVRTELHTSLDKHRSEVVSAKATLLECSSQASQAATNLENAHSACQAGLKQIGNDLLVVRAGYRQVNLGIRTTPAPSYFADETCDVPESHDGQMQAALTAIRSVHGRSEELKKRYLDVIAARLRKLVTDAAQMEKELISEYQANIRVQAEREIADRQQIVA